MQAPHHVARPASVWNPGPSTVPLSESMRSVLTAPLIHLTSLSQTLISSLSPPTSSFKPPTAPPISEFLACDKEMAKALQQARIHQAKQRRVDELIKEVLELDGRLRDIVGVLLEGKEELAGIIEEGEERLEGIEKASKSESHILSHSLDLTLHFLII